MDKYAWKAYEEFIPTRQSLLSRLKDRNDDEGWKVFFDTYWRLIYSTARKAGLNDSEAQDVVQETVISVLKSMPTFNYDVVKGSFKGWLLRLTKWRILDHLRRVKSQSAHLKNGGRDAADAAEIENIADPAGMKVEVIWDEEWEQNLLVAAIERIKKKVDSKHFQTFDLLVFKGWPVSKVAKAMGINAGRAYLIKHRLSRLVKTEIKLLKRSPI